jgi:AAA domain
MTALPEVLIPLTLLDHWLAWRFEKKEDGQLTKVPYQINGRKAANDNPKTWTTYDAVTEAANKFDGVGFVLTDTRITAFDLDHCRNPATGAVEPWAQAVVDKAASYTEITPSGAGLRIIGFGDGAHLHRKLKVPNANGVSCELYRKAIRYITVSGNVYRDTPMVNIDATIDAVLKELDTGTSSSIRNAVLTDVAGVEPDVPIVSLDDDRLQQLSYAACYMIENAAPPANASDSIRALKGGNGHCFVVGQLVELGLSNAQIKEVYGLGQIGDGPRGHPRGFDGYVERTIARCRSSVIDDLDFSDVDVDAFFARLRGENPPIEESSAEQVVEQRVQSPEAIVLEPVPPKPQEKASGTSDQIKTDASAVDTKAKEAPKPNIHATPFDWIVPGNIPLRRWVYRPHYIRKFASLTVSTGGIGKSSQLIVEALAMASGKPLLETQPEKKLRVWYWNGEDPMDELQRRFAAAVKHYGLKQEDIGDRLFVDSGRIMQIVIAVELKRVAQISMPVIKEVIATLLENEIDVLMIDPFVSCHRVNENDNAAIERVAKSWSYIAEETNCSVMLAHHSRKTGSGEGVTVDDGRGASALVNAVRSARTLNNMSVREAENAEIDERERRSYFRADIGKANLTPPAETAEWFKLVSINLENGEGDAFWCGDHVGVVTAWKYPNATAPTITASDIRRAQDAIKAGNRWREDQRSRNELWVGIPVAAALGLDLDRKKDKRAVVDLVRTWLAAGWLKKVGGQDAGRKPRDYIEAGKAPADEVPRPNEAASDIPF